MTAENQAATHAAQMDEWNAPGWRPRAYEKPAPGSALEKRLTTLNTEIAEQRHRFAAAWPTLDAWFRHLYAARVAGQPDEAIYQPRKLNPPGGFAAVCQVASGLYSILGECSELLQAGEPPAPTQITALSLAYAVCRQQVPIYYVSEPFLRAVAATDLPPDFTLLDLNFPRPGLVLGLPLRFMREYCGQEIGYVYAADLAEGDHTPPRQLSLGSLPAIRCPAKIGWGFYTYEQGVLESFVSSFLKRDRVDDALTKYAYTDFTDAPAAKVDADQELTTRINVLLFKLLFVLNLRPGLVEHGQLERPAKFKHGVQVRGELWSANVIGARYQIARQGTATHASPAVHWRRGHSTMQRIGSPKAPDFVSVNALPRRTDGEIDWLAVTPEVRDAFWRCHKRLWLEPVLVNLAEATPA